MIARILWSQYVVFCVVLVSSSFQHGVEDSKDKIVHDAKQRSVEEIELNNMLCVP